MPDNEITTDQQNQLDLLAVLQYDTAALKKAVDFIQGDPFKQKLFIAQYNRVYSEGEIVARTIKAVQESTEALAVINADSAATQTTAV